MVIGGGGGGGWGQWGHGGRVVLVLQNYFRKKNCF